MQGFSHYTVAVPPGVQSGQAFTAVCGTATVSVVVPPGAGPGSLLQVQVPTSLQPMPVAVAQPTAALPSYAQEPSPFGYQASSAGWRPPQAQDPLPTAAAYPPPAGSAETPTAPAYPQAGAYEHRPAPEAQQANTGSFNSNRNGSGRANSRAGSRAGPDGPERWPAACCGLLGLLRAFRVSVTLLLLGLLLVLSGKLLQESVRPRETSTLWEVAACCATPISSMCASSSFVSYYAGPGLLCPYGATPDQPQAFTLTESQWQGSGGATALSGPPLAGSFKLVLYASARTAVDLTYSVVAAGGAPLLTNVQATIGANGGRRLAEASAHGLAHEAAAGGANGGVGGSRWQRAAAGVDGGVGTPTAAAQATTRRLLKGGSSGSSGGFGSSGRSSSGGGTTYGSAGRSSSTGGRASAQSSRAASTRSSTYYSGRGPSSTAYGSGVRQTRYGTYAPVAVGSYGLLGRTSRRHTGRGSRSNSSDVGGEEEEETRVEDELARAEFTSSPLTTSSSSFPLTMTVSSLKLNSEEARSVDNPPYLFVGFQTTPSESDRLRFQVGIALWAVGTAMIGLLYLASLWRFFRFVEQDNVQPARYGRSIRNWKACMCSAGLATMVAGFVGVAYPYVSPKAAGAVAVIVGALLLLAFFCRRTWPYEYRANRPLRAQDDTTWLRLLGQLLFIVGLHVLLIEAVRLDVIGEPATPGVIVGVCLVVLAGAALWVDIKGEHAKD